MDKENKNIIWNFVVLEKAAMSRQSREAPLNRVRLCATEDSNSCRKMALAGNEYNAVTANQTAPITTAGSLAAPTKDAITEPVMIFNDILCYSNIFNIMVCLRRYSYFYDSVPIQHSRRTIGIMHEVKYSGGPTSFALCLSDHDPARRP